MEPQTFHDHVKELRRRLLWVIIALSASSTLVYVYRLKFISVLSKPISTPLYYTSPLGGFNLAIKISTIFGLILALPFIVYNVVKFIEPALPKNLKHSSIFRMLIFSLSLAILGAAFGYFVILPMSLHFFMGYSTGTIKPLISATEYLNYVLNIIITFALLFQIPLAIIFIDSIKPLKPRKLLKYQKYVIVGAFIIAVVLPFTYDPITQFVMAVPIIFLYYLSIVLLLIIHRNRNKKHLKSNLYKAYEAPVISPGTLADSAYPILEPELVEEPSFQFQYIGRNIDGIMAKNIKQKTNKQVYTYRSIETDNDIVSPVVHTKGLKNLYIDGLVPIKKQKTNNTNLGLDGAYETSFGDAQAITASA